MLSVICVAAMADTQRKEKEIFKDHFPNLCNTMVDIDNLLPHFVQENIIQVDDLEEIKAKPRTTDKVEKLLQYISGPLKAGNVKSFHTMLSIMEEHGTQATRELASTMRSHVITDNNNTSKCSIHSKQDTCLMNAIQSCDTYILVWFTNLCMHVYRRLQDGCQLQFILLVISCEKQPIRYFERI